MSLMLGNIYHVARRRGKSRNTNNKDKDNDSDVAMVENYNSGPIAYRWDTGAYKSFRAPARSILHTCKNKGRGIERSTGGYAVVGTCSLHAAFLEKTYLNKS